MMMVMTNRPELRPPLLLLIMSGLVISNDLPSREISPSQNMTTSRSPQATQPSGGPGGFTAAHTDGNKTSVSPNSSAGTERNITNAWAAGTGNSTGSENPLPTGPPVRNSTSASASSTGPREGTHKQATNSSTATPTNTTRPPSSHVTEKGASTTAKPASTKPQSTQSSQTPGKTTTTITTSRDNKGHTCHVCPTKEPHKKDSLVGRCLIAISSLAGLAIIFIVSTIILATKLASSRYRNRMRLLEDTEMVCISALMNDTEHPMPKPRHPKSNGALIPGTEEEDVDVLTLNSFLPDTESAMLN